MLLLINLEAYADYPSGFWLGLRMALSEEHDREAVLTGGLELKSDIVDNPSAYQRDQLVQDAMDCAALLVHIIEPQIPP